MIKYPSFGNEFGKFCSNIRGTSNREYQFSKNAKIGIFLVNDNPKDNKITYKHPILLDPFYLWTRFNPDFVVLL